MTRSRGALARAGALLGGALQLAACHNEPGAPFECSCSFLTDFDDGSRTVVDVCAPSRAEADSAARGCAQSAAPAAIDACTCAPAASAAPCSAGACRAR